MREPRENLERRLESVARAKRRELERSQAAERHRILTEVCLNGCGGEENLENDS